MTYQPGPIALFGSGEIAPAGRRVHEALFRRLKPPIRVVVLETPAGFQPNSAWVADRLAEFIRERLQNFHPDVTVVPRGEGMAPSAPTTLNGTPLCSGPTTSLWALAVRPTPCAT